MSGLLDKANKSVEPNDNKSEEDVSDATLEMFGKTDGTGKIDNKVKAGMQISGVVLLLVSMFLLVQTGFLYAELTDYLLAIFVMLLGWIIYNGSDYLSTGLSNTTMVITAIGFAGLFVATIVGTVFMNAGGGVTIASVELDGDDNEIDVSFFGPSGMSYTVEVLVDGTVEYSYDGEINIDRDSHSIAIDEFWAGNAINMNEISKVTYELKVTSEEGEESFKFDSFMNREADTGFVKVNEIFSTSAQGEKEYTGISVEMIIGIGEPDAFFDFSNPDDPEAASRFTGEAPMSIVSDWEATLTVKKGSSVEYVYPTITADEGFAPGYGDFWNNWVAIPGEGGAAHLGRDLFYSGDGCYTFEVEIVNVLGDTYTDSSSEIKFFWDYNEASDGSKPAEAC